jgi:hypothetical protein
MFTVADGLAKRRAKAFMKAISIANPLKAQGM